MGSQIEELLGARVERSDEPLELPEPIVDATLPGGRAHLRAARDRMLLSIDGVGSFVVEEGRRIRYAAEPTASDGELAAFLQGIVASLLLAQRRQFALHGSVVDVRGAAVAVCGFRNAGKSTTALRLEQRGHALVTDDLSVLSTGRGVTVEPLAHPMRLHPETAERLGIDTSGAIRVPAQEKLMLLRSASPPRPLRAIAILEIAAELAVARLSGAKAHWALVSHTYRGALFRRLWETELFAWAGAVAARVPVYSITRPAGDWTVDAVADAVEEIACRT